MAGIEGGKTERFPLAICAFAVLVRVLVPVTAYLFTSDPQVFHAPDTNSYIRPTQELLSDGTFSINGKADVHRTPGYSLILAPGIAANHVEVVTSPYKSFSALYLFGLFFLAHWNSLPRTVARALLLGCMPSNRFQFFTRANY